MKESKVDNQYIVNEKLQSEIFHFQDLSHKFNWRSIKIASVRELSVLPDGHSISIKFDFGSDAKEMKILKKHTTKKILTFCRSRKKGKAAVPGFEPGPHACWLFFLKMFIVGQYSVHSLIFFGINKHKKLPIGCVLRNN